MKIGIPRALLYYRYGIFWETFFQKLGHETVLSPRTNKDILTKGEQLSIDENCLSTKLFFGHVAALEGKCDYCFVPRIANLGDAGRFCSRFEALPDMCSNMFRDTDLKILRINIDPEQHVPAKRAYLKLAMQLGASHEQAQAAYEAGMAAQMEDFRKRIKLNRVLLKKEGIKVLVVSHPYNLYDEYIGAPIIKSIRNLDAIPICSDGIDPREARSKASEIARHVPWVVSRELLGAIQTYRNQIDGIVLITAFPCGPDSMVNEMIIRRISHVPILNLLLDSQDGNAGIDTRLESFIDIIRFRKEVEL